MRPKTLFIAILPAVIFAVLLGLRAANSLPRSTVPPTHVSPDQATPVERGKVQVDAGVLPSATTKPVLTQAAPLKEGLVLVESHCTQCHTAQWLAQIEKSRAEWEKALVQMEALGVHLEEPEKVVLLDYLAIAGQP